MFRTENYARIQCSECKKMLDELIPGRVFTQIKECECQKKEVKKNVRKTTKKTESSESK